MFGYVLPDKPELKMREYELFRAYYCGVCKEMGKRSGQLSRMTLNYDITFLALLLSAVSGDYFELKRERCIAHPVKKRLVAKNSKIIKYASDINVILAYYNIEDNWKDDKSILSGSAMIALKRSFKRLRKKHSEKCQIIEEKLSELHQLEREKCNSIDRAAEPFAKLMEAIMEYLPACRNEADKKILSWIGYNLGKWIYTIDAYDDLEKDIKKGNYNPLIYQYNYQIGEDTISFKNRIKDMVEFNLTYCLSQMAKSFELLDIRDNKRTGLKDIVDNVIFLGMLKKTEQILGMRSCGKIEESI